MFGLVHRTCLASPARSGRQGLELVEEIAITDGPFGEVIA